MSDDLLDLPDLGFLLGHRRRFYDPPSRDRPPFKAGDAVEVDFGGEHRVQARVAGCYFDQGVTCVKGPSWNVEVIAAGEQRRRLVAAGCVIKSTDVIEVLARLG